MITALLLATVVVLAALLFRERRRRRALRGDYIGRTWALRARLREVEDEADELRARLLFATLTPGVQPLIEPEGDGDNLPLPVIPYRRVPPA